MQADGLSLTPSTGGPDTLTCVIAQLENPPDNTSSPNSSPNKKMRLPKLPTETVIEMRSWGMVTNWMIPFWNDYQSSLATFGIQFCDLHDSHCDAQPAPYELAPYFGCARNASQQDLFVKMIDKGTPEDQIYRYLAGCKELYDSCTFKWGAGYRITDFNTLRAILTFIRCTLTGLTFLHDHRIAHRDIHETNILLNWYCRDIQKASCTERLRAHYQSSSALYALFDFDLSLHLPPTTSLKDCLRPASEAFIGRSDYHPTDIYQGEPYYNPFAFDVACLGNLFSYYFAEAIPANPFLAALFSRMTTHIIDDRFTAAEALAFVREIEGELPPDVLDSAVTLRPDCDVLDHPERYWSRLHPDDQIKWQAHRPPPLTWTTRVLRRISTTELGCRVVPFVRRSLGI
ncbi:hypothetical protein ONZ51_g12893 [Trametes cubensis]|uniref:Protein kinase domain-containing protein n=1 Tax=Trametes cubensis TaxID=1111947 RepID=A0AAD7TGB9_9APHY|nr:hypothetical protein ONZ51_g12893 [Trametes cubensis]